jgi:branched-chain amino acid transport system permease protein
LKISDILKNSRNVASKGLHYGVYMTVLAVLIVLPYTGFVPRLSLLFYLFMFIIGAQSFNIMGGYTGYVCFGHVAFIGAGAYITAVLMARMMISPYLAIVAAGIGSMVLAVIIGYPCLRLRGAYFAIATLSINEAIKVLILYLPEEWVGGYYGITLPPIYTPVECYYSMLGLMLATIIVTYRVVNSKLGFGLVAIREDEDAAEFVGIDTTKCKILAFMLSAFFAGVAGGIDAWFTTYIEPYGAFGIPKTTEMIAMCMFGGAGTIAGPILGSAILFLVGDFLWARLPYLHMIIFSVIILVVVLFMPQGLMGWLKEKYFKILR